jgi:hypothetical protein
MRWIAIVGILLISAPTQAWGQTGHRVTGAIAERYLTPETKAAIEAILGTETLAEASTWPDEQRSNPAPFWQSTANPFHYVKVPTGKTYAEVGAPERGDSVTALKRFSATIKDPDASLEEKQLALRFIVHIIGDLHQPLHAGNGHDRGGNTIDVTYFGQETNLHRVWDGHLIDGEKLSFTEMADWLKAKTSPEDGLVKAPKSEIRFTLKTQI